MHDLAIDPPVVVVATEEEWASRSLESVLVNQGYVVIRALDGQEALSAARNAQPDAVLLDEHLSLVGGIDVCAQLRADASVDAATPIIIMASSPAPHGVRLAAFAAGA